MGKSNLSSNIPSIDENDSKQLMPLEFFLAVMQGMVWTLATQENYSTEYLLVSMLSTVGTAIGNSYQIRVEKNSPNSSRLRIWQRSHYIIKKNHDSILDNRQVSM